jgi:hypothetical protein
MVIYPVRLTERQNSLQRVGINVLAVGASGHESAAATLHRLHSAVPHPTLCPPTWEPGTSAVALDTCTRGNSR